MSKATDEFGSALADLAKHVAEKAGEDSTPFAETLDAFGKLTAYYGLLLKNRGSIPAEDDEPTIGRIQERLREAEEAPDVADQRAAIRRRAGRGAG